MNTHPYHKLWIISGLLAISGGLTYAASTLIKPDLDNTIQSIEQIIFSPTGNPHANEVLMHSDQGVLLISGALNTAKPGTDSRFTPTDPYSTLIGGEKNEHNGTNTALIAGKQNKILSGDNAVILGG